MAVRGWLGLTALLAAVVLTGGEEPPCTRISATLQQIPLHEAFARLAAAAPIPIEVSTPPPEFARRRVSLEIHDQPLLATLRKLAEEHGVGLRAGRRSIEVLWPPYPPAAHIAGPGLLLSPETVAINRQTYVDLTAQRAERSGASCHIVFTGWLDPGSGINHLELSFASATDDRGRDLLPAARSATPISVNARDGRRQLSPMAIRLNPPVGDATAVRLQGELICRYQLPGAEGRYERLDEPYAALSLGEHTLVYRGLIGLRGGATGHALLLDTGAQPAEVVEAVRQANFRLHLADGQTAVPHSSHLLGTTLQLRFLATSPAVALTWTGLGGERENRLPVDLTLPLPAIDYAETPAVEPNPPPELPPRALPLTAFPATLVTCQADRQPLPAVLDALRRDSGFAIALQDQLVRGTRRVAAGDIRVTIDAVNRPFWEVLDQFAPIQGIGSGRDAAVQLAALWPADDDRLPPPAVAHRGGLRLALRRVTVNESATSRFDRSDNDRNRSQVQLEIQSLLEPKGMIVSQELRFDSVVLAGRELVVRPLESSRYTTRQITLRHSFDLPAPLDGVQAIDRLVIGYQVQRCDEEIDLVIAHPDEAQSLDLEPGLRLDWLGRDGLRYRYRLTGDALPAELTAADLVNQRRLQLIDSRGFPIGASLIAPATPSDIATLSAARASTAATVKLRWPRGLRTYAGQVAFDAIALPAAKP